MRPGDVGELVAAPPLPFRRTSPYKLELNERSGWLAALFGVPFFLAGVFMTLSLIGILPYEFTPRRGWDSLVLPLVALSFLGLGGVMLFGRRWLTLDVSSGSVTRRQGLLVPMLSEVRGLSEFTAVALSFDAGGSDAPDRYPVLLRSAGGRNFIISAPQQFSEARKQAEYLSRFLRLPLADATTDHETVVRPDQAGDSLRDRLRRGEAETVPPVRPAGMLCKVVESSGETKIIIPGPRFPMSGVLGVLAPLAILLIVIPAIVRGFSSKLGAGGGHVVFVILLMILGIPAIFCAIWLIVDGSRHRTMVKASPAGLAIERRSAWRTRIKVVSASDILDVDQSTFEGTLASKTKSRTMAASLPATSEGLLGTLRTWVPSTGILVKSRHEVITFGEGLPASELRYLRWVLRKALASG